MDDVDMVNECRGTVICFEDNDDGTFTLHKDLRNDGNIGEECKVLHD